MIVSVYLPLLFCVGLAAFSGRAVRRLPPRLGLWVLTAAAVAGAASTVWSLVLLAGVLVDDLSRFGHAQARVPVPDMVSVAAAAALAVVVVRLVVTVRAESRDRRSLRAFGIADQDESGVTIVDDPRVDAFAVADGAASRIVVTSGMLALLGPDQRQALIAHEHAHLDRGHATAGRLVRWAAAANPVLTPVRHAVAFLCERDADECAAAIVGRATAAQAVAVAALGRRSAGSPHGAPALHRLAVTDRVRALMTPAADRPLSAGPLVVALALLIVVVVDATEDFSAIVAAIVA